jgi:RimJ/RimL family protein N-acetyltransferase
MKIYKYGLVLSRLREEDIELVRKWRNSEQIRQFMEYREEITPEMQKEWFNTIDNFDNYYFIIEYEGEKIGLINTSKIDLEKRSSEGGIFLWEEKYYETMVPVWASLLLLETNIFLLNAEKSYIKTLKDNERAKKLNVHLGYKLMDGQENVDNQEYELTRESFIEKSGKLIKAANLMAPQDAHPFCMYFDNEDIKSGLAEHVQNQMVDEYIESVENKGDGRYIYIKPYSG